MSALPAPDPAGTALVTGASSGIGEALARELAARGYGVTLVARREERLRALADELRAAHGIRAEPLACDLADPPARAELPARVQALGLHVDILVNNAGFATGGPFIESSVERELRQLRLLSEAVVDLCARFVPAMAERGRGGVLTVSSTAGMQPLPLSAGYSAAKAHSLTFTEALHSELKPRGVIATALCPGPVETELFDAAGGHPVEEAMPRFVWVSPEDVAKAGVDGLAAGKRVVVPGLHMRVATGSARFVPRFVALPAIKRVFNATKTGRGGGGAS